MVIVEFVVGVKKQHFLVLCVGSFTPSYSWFSPFIPVGQKLGNSLARSALLVSFCRYSQLNAWFNVFLFISSGPTYMTV